MTVLTRLLFACVLFVAFGDIAKANTQTMVTSWYGPGLQGNPMANGERFDMNDASVVAHKSLPFGTCIRLVNPANNRSHRVTVQDRGPFIHGRDLDVSKAAATKLGFIERGVATLQATRLPQDECRS